MKQRKLMKKKKYHISSTMLLIVSYCQVSETVVRRSIWTAKTVIPTFKYYPHCF